MHFLSSLRCNRGLGLALGCFFGFLGFVWVVFLIGFLFLGFVFWVCFLGATYELGALYPFVFDAPYWVFCYIQYYLSKKKKEKKKTEQGNQNN
jgi:hypothetical protein